MGSKSKSLLEFVENHPRSKEHAIGDFSWVNEETPLEKLDLDWKERGLPERLRTKHVHRLHPYLGKFVPQLVEIFLRKYRPSVVCDPFCGSGTTLVEANALGINVVGCDISAFNCLLSKVKTDDYDYHKLNRELKDITAKTYWKSKESSLAEKLLEKEDSTYLKDWFHKKALGELLIYRSMIPEYEYQDSMKIILSRSARSARLTTHYNLDFPKKPQTTSYHCYKHNRICKPTDDALIFLKRYGEDTFKRIKEFAEIKTSKSIKIICGDSRSIRFPKCDAIMTSPPYVGLIDYHEQHRYAYELLKLPDRRGFEIGAASSGNSKRAQQNYIDGIGQVFANVRKSMTENGVAVIVVHDKNKLYDGLAEKCGFFTENMLTRKVDRRTGRRASEFFEQILIWRAK